MVPARMLSVVVVTLAAWVAISVVVALAFGRALKRRNESGPGSPAGQG
jgi:hypothetical protein